MSHLYFFEIEFFADGPAYFIDHLKGCPVEWLVDEKHLSVYEIFCIHDLGFNQPVGIRQLDLQVKIRIGNGNDANGKTVDGKIIIFRLPGMKHSSFSKLCAQLYF